MKRGYPPPWACAVLLALLLLWRMLGAPLTAEQFSHLETPFWQARALLPLRVARILTLWFPTDSAEPETLPQEAMTQEERALMAMSDIDGGLIGGASLKAEDFSKVVHFNN